MSLREEDILDFIKKASPRPVSLSEINRGLALALQDRKLLRRLLRRMRASGMLERGTDGKYRASSQKRVLMGKVHGKPAVGYAFVELEDGITEDIYVREEALAGAMHRDRVEVEVIAYKPYGRLEGRVTRILERAYKTVVGYYETSGKVARVIPAERKLRQEIYIPYKERRGARKGDVVLAQITEYPREGRGPSGKIIEVLGDQEQEDIELQIIIHKHDIPHEFPPQALKEAEECTSEVKEEELTNREDLRGVLSFTIDGERARDFDDAVSLQRLENGNLLLGVHIADVSHYVLTGSALDLEARQRGNSVYFPDRAIPMLPHQLSNDICSLNPLVDRLTLSVFMELTTAGEMLGYRISESAIRSKARLTYTIANELISGQMDEPAKEFAHLRNTLIEMADLAMTLRRNRLETGSMDFDLPEPEVVFDVEGGMESVVRAERNVAHQLIEEFMLIANKTVATHISKRGVPSLYRIHERPDPEKLEDFTEFVRSMGHDARGIERGGSRELQRILDEVAGRAESLLINDLLLRSMKRARYTTVNTGHFALAFDCYTHFTSPIRRYPDLVIHRILKLLQRGFRVEEEFPEGLESIAEHSSHRERAAEEAEREVMKLMCSKLMERHLGEEFDGVVIGIISSGLFIELEQYFIEGFIHVTELRDDYYRFDEKAHALVGRRKGSLFRIGNRVRIRVTNVSVQQRHIDFTLVRRL